MKSLKTLLIILLIWTTLDTVAQVTIGTQVQQSEADEPSPYNSYYRSRHIQIVYTASEIIAAGGLTGNITALAWDISELTNETLIDYQVRMALTSATDASTHNTAPLTTVKNAFDYTTPAAIGWNTITFDTPFPWDGSQNILIDVCWGIDNDYPEEGSVWLYNIVANQMISKSNDYSTLCDEATDATTSGKPRIQLTMPMATCLPPTSLAATSITNNSAELTWVPSGSAENWRVEYGPMGFQHGNGTKVLVNTTPALPISSLTPNTYYKFYVRAICSPSDSSSWSDSLLFKTNCDAQTTFPYFEGFEGALFPPDCWKSELTAGSGITWTRNTIGTHPDCNPHTGIAMARFYSYYDNGKKGILVTNTITIPDDNYEVTFWMYRDDEYETSHDSLVVYINNTPNLTGTPTKIKTINRYYESDPIESSVGWHKYTATFGASSAGNKYVIFEGISNNGNNIFIDDVSVHEIPTCFEPTNLNASNITDNSAKLSWTTGGANRWNIEYGNTGFAIGTGTYIPNVQNDTFNLTGLTANHNYDFYVRDSCAADDTSAWAGPFTFKTLCSPETVFPYFEGFEGALFPPDCWSTQLIAGSGTTWTRETIGTHPDCNPHTGIAMARFYSYYDNGKKGILVTNAITIPDDDYEVTFWMHRDDGYDTKHDSLTVYINPTPDLSGTPVKLNTINRYVGFDPVVAVNGWYKYTCQFGSGSAGLKYVVFEGSSCSGNNMFIDDVNIHKIPTCFEPTNLDTLDITQTSAKLTWTTGGATAWNVEYGNYGFTPGTGTHIQAANDTTQITGLQASNTYQFYVRDTCPPNDYSLWAGPFTFNTKCGAITALPYDEGFESSPLPACWTTFQLSETEAWEDVNHIDEIDFPHSGIRFAGKYYNESESVLVSPEFSFSNITGTLKYQIWVYRSSDYDDGDSITFYVNSTDTTLGATRLGMIPLGNDITPTAPEGWNQYTFEIPASFNDSPFYLLFLGSTADLGYSLGLDDLHLYEYFPCEVPVGLAANNVTENSADLSWTSVLGFTYKLEYGDHNFVIGTGTVVNPAVSPVHLAGLTSSHSYDFYVKAYCLEGDSTVYAGPFQFTTQSPVSVYEISKDSYKIYPNPTTDKFYIYADNIDRVEVYDITGKMIINVNISNSSKPAVVDLSAQSKGIYMIKLFSGDKISFEKIAKQ